MSVVTSPENQLLEELFGAIFSTYFPSSTLCNKQSSCPFLAQKTTPCRSRLPLSSFTPLSQSFSLDMCETGTGYTVRADLPGVERENISVNVDNGVLTISTKREDSHTESTRNGQSYFSERTYGSFSRSVSVPTSVTGQDVSARYSDGVLTIDIRHQHPQTEERKSGNVTVM